ncbi:hypothetical protein TYRP_008121 [Tyrophagus putrescentiae]|nr:hypothetical protein TYRP_008121 [Tyrophagus putrescentiae]
MCSHFDTSIDIFRALITKQSETENGIVDVAAKVHANAADANGAQATRYYYYVYYDYNFFVPQSPFHPFHSSLLSALWPVYNH